MNYLGIDFGEKKIGLAVSSGLLARPLSIVHFTSLQEGVAKLTQIIKQENIEHIVMGFPEADQKTPLARVIKTFGEHLHEKTAVRVTNQEET